MSANVYDSTAKKLIPFAGNSATTAASLDGLSDVSLSSPTDGQALVYDGTDAEWKNISADSTPASGSSNFVTSGGVYTALADKVDKVTGKGLSANDFTDALKDKLDDIEPNAEVNVQADWSETDTTDDAYIANKPTLGTASAKDAPVSGDATNTQVVLGSDSRLSDARPASDVSAWAKAATKPTYTAVEVGAIASTEKGIASGVAELDANGKVPSSQLPSFVDDVKEGYLNSADGKFYEESTYETEITPEADKIYVDKATNITYRWSGSAFVAIGSDLALGETSTTAYRGDRGKAAYDHASDAGKISAATASGFYKVGATAEGHVSSLTAVTKDDILDLGISEGDSVDLPMGPLFSRTQPTAWKEKDWGVEFTIFGNNIWSDGENIYYSIADDNDPINYVLNRSTGTWEEKDWSGGALTSFNGMNVWTDGTNVYYSSVDEEVGNFVLNKSTGLWEYKDWGEFNNALEGYAIWTDGKFVYCSREGHYTLYLANGAWHDIIWTVEDVSVSFMPAGYKIWTDGNNIYFSDTDYYTLNLVLVKNSSSSAPSLTWKQKTWNGLTQFDGQWVWADGTNIYYADPNANPQIHYVLDTATSTWIEKDWNMAIGLFYPSDVWSDGNNIYYSSFDDYFERSVSYVLTGNISADNTNLNLGTAATKDVATSGDASASQVVMGNDSRLTDARNAADVSAWAKAATKPTYTASEVGLGNVGNFKAVSTEASQGLTNTEKANARANIGAGTEIIKRTVTANAGATSVTFTNIPTTSDYLLTLFSTSKTLEYDEVTSVSNSVTYTFDSLETSVDFTLKIEEV